MKSSANFSSGRTVLSSLQHHNVSTSTKSMTKSITFLIGFSLISMLVIFIYSGSLWSDLYGNEKQNPSNMTHPHVKDTDETVTKKPRGTGGLYEANPYVTEIYTSSELNTYKVNEKNLMVVFYASWCGHCRNFAPKFTAVAQKVTLRTNELNEENPLAVYPKTHFLAVNCVTLRNVCDSHKVEFYPAIQVFNFVNTDSKTKTRMEGIESELMKFFSKTIFLHGELEKKSSAAKNKVSSSDINNIVKLSHSTENSEERIHDALSSLLFFLMNELPEELSQQRVASLLSMLDILSFLMQAPTKISKTLSPQLMLAQSIFTNVKVVLYKYSKSPFLPRNKIIEALRPAISAYRPQDSFPPKMEWRICGVTGPAVSTLRGSKHKPNTDPGTGYSCGLWLLFHYMTLQGEIAYARREESNAAIVTAVSIMHGIHSFVENFFGCKECRAHFLQYYKLEWFGRNRIQTDDDFLKLQIWLFQLHNLVSSRIHLEKAYGMHLFSNDSSSTSSSRDWQKYEELILLSFWPTQRQCPQCYNPDRLRALNKLDHGKAQSWEDVIRPVVEQSFQYQPSIEYLKKMFILP